MCIGKPDRLDKLIFPYISFNPKMSPYLYKLNCFKRIVLVLPLKANCFNNPTGLFLFCSLVSIHTLEVHE